MNDNFLNKQPTDVPNDEEIFEHFLGRAAPELSRRVLLYLKANPQKERELREWALIESRFGEFPLKSPDALVLNRVRNMAREQMGRTADSPGWLANLKARFSSREWALVFTLVVAVFVSHAMRQAPSERNAVESIAVNANSDGSRMASRTEPAANAVVLSGTMTAADEIIQALTDYDAAVDLYQAGSFREANRGFAEIVSKRPYFEKRRELYTYWVESLKKLGKYALAEKKQKILEDVIAEEIAPH